MRPRAKPSRKQRTVTSSRVVAGLLLLAAEAAIVIYAFPVAIRLDSPNSNVLEYGLSVVMFLVLCTALLCLGGTLDAWRGPVITERPAPTGFKYPLCSRQFATEQAVTDHGHGKHGVRGRITPKRLWPHD